MKPSGDVRILIVDDDVYFQRILHRRLEAEGYQVTCAADGREGMKHIVTWDPHVVLSDWMMPHVDGLELCQSVKTGLRENAPYFILLTAKGEINDRLLGLDTGADDYLVKPCDQGEILARVRAGLRNVLLSRELARTKAQLQTARADLEVARVELRALLNEVPFCKACKKVQTLEGTWEDLHALLAARGLAHFVFRSCPECKGAMASKSEGSGELAA